MIARKVIPYLWPYRLPFLFALGQIFLINSLELLKPWPIKVVIDNVLGHRPMDWWFLPESGETLLLLACAALVLIYLLLGALHLINNTATIRIGQRMVNDLRGDLYIHLQRLSLAFHNRQKVGDLLY
ncbi:MAG: ABC transporter transmembrane domain-containing protein, partial [Candidatus Binatia bacterium]